MTGTSGLGAVKAKVSERKRRKNGNTASTMNFEILLDVRLHAHDLHPLWRVLKRDAEEEQTRDGKMRRGRKEANRAQLARTVRDVDLESRR